MTDQNIHMIEFMVALIDEFARRFGLSDKEAYKYISQYNGVQMFMSHYAILHTLSFADMVDGMAAYCHRQGGKLI